jgi:hypothetical protein
MDEWIRWDGVRRQNVTFDELLDGDVGKFLDYLHGQTLLVALDDDGCIALIATSEAEFAQGVFDGLGNVYGVGLTMQRGSEVDAK